ncbi:TspO/MBR family protein [Heliorestis convoluta]|uniref:TspO/MBR family protein n=1 Tax=Heliorestis convoluta TaxID=356322 RepID=UPI00129B79C0|nr:TspO/MBR family protein [Heliorestis convoluta]
MVAVRDLFKLVAALLICLYASWLGAKYTLSSFVWYHNLNKPWFNPAAHTFEPVWLILYTMMSLSLFLVWRQSPQKDVRFALFLFGLQLALNVMWSWIFFGLQSPFWATVEIVLLMFVIGVTIFYFYRYSKWAAILLVPYFLRTGYEALLTFLIWRMN